MSVLKRFEQYLVGEGLSESTIQTYIGYLRTASRVSGINNPADYLDTDITANTRNSAYTALRHWAAFSDDEKLLAKLDDPKLKRKLKGRGKRASRVTRPLTGDELERFVVQVDHLRGKDPLWAWPCLTLLLRLALRAEVDLCRLTRGELVEATRSGRLRLETKGGKMRTLPLSPVRAAVSELLKVGKWRTVAETIVGEDDPKRAYREVYKVIKTLAREASLDPSEVHPHRLRHTAAHMLWEQTRDILKVRDFLGHSNVATTERYLRGDRTDEIGDDLRGIYGETD